MPIRSGRIVSIGEISSPLDSSIKNTVDAILAKMDDGPTTARV